MISRVISQSSRQLILRRSTGSATASTAKSVLAKSSNDGAIASTSTVTNPVRCYVSRAHRRTTPEEVYPIANALEDVLEGVSERIERRAARWERNKEKRAKAGTVDEGPYANQDETIELVLNLNLDPRKPGQSLRGSLPLPHGTGKRTTVAVFASDSDTDTLAAVKLAGATLAGGTDLVKSIADGDTPVNFDRAIATPDMMPGLSKIARVLGPRGLMPNAKLGTIRDVEEIVDAVKREVDGMVQYRAEKDGIVHVGVGKGSFGNDRLLDNIKTFLGEIQSVKPESFGKGKTKAGGSNKGAKYFLKAYLTATQGKSVNLDIRTVDPTSNFYMETVVN